MEVKSPVARVAVAVPVAAPASVETVTRAKAVPAADAFGGASGAAPVVSEAPVEAASADALWGAAEVSVAAAAEAITKPTWTGAKVEKDRWGNLALTFTVAKGDTLAKLGRHAGMDFMSLANANLIDNPNVISVGQKITVPTTFHEVKKGETYWGIANKLGLDHKLLMKLNGAADTVLRVGQEIRVPASIVTEAQAKTRAELVKVLDNAAAAESAMYFGKDSFRPRHMGNDLGYTGVADTDVRFEFSDDFSTVKVKRGQGDEPPAVSRLSNPVAEVKKMVVTDTIRGLAHLRAEELRTKFPEFPGAFNVVGPKHHKDGTVGFTITGPADGDDYLSYDPKAGTLTVSDNSDRKSILAAGQPTDVVAALKQHFKMKLPAYA